jgi:fructose-specific phosphotransferase system component IIB
MTSCPLGIAHLGLTDEQRESVASRIELGHHVLGVLD